MYDVKLISCDTTPRLYYTLAVKVCENDLSSAIGAQATCHPRITGAYFLIGTKVQISFVTLLMGGNSDEYN